MRRDCTILILFLEESEFISVSLFPFYFLNTATISKNFSAVVFCRFKDNDVMVLKAGMRERRDAPGTLSRNILIIAPIGIDHTDYLNKIEIEIAGKKTVITSENSKLTLAPQLSDAYRKIVDCAKENGLKFEYINGNYDKNNQT